MIRTVQDDYSEMGPIYARAYGRMAQSCQFPPSLEVFQHELHEMQKLREGVTVETLADSISRGYQRIPI